MTRVICDPILRSKGHRHQAAWCHNRKLAISSKREDLWTSNLVYGWSTMAHVTNLYVDFQRESSGGCSSHHLQGGGRGILWQPPTTSRTACCKYQWCIEQTWTQLYVEPASYGLQQMMCIRKCIICKLRGNGLSCHFVTWHWFAQLRVFTRKKIKLYFSSCGQHVGSYTTLDQVLHKLFHRPVFEDYGRTFYWLWLTPATSGIARLWGALVQQ